MRSFDWAFAAAFGLETVVIIFLINDFLQRTAKVTKRRLESVLEVISVVIALVTICLIIATVVLLI